MYGVDEVEHFVGPLAPELAFPRVLRIEDRKLMPPVDLPGRNEGADEMVQGATHR
jgi:hypothetical protein